MGQGPRQQDPLVMNQTSQSFSTASPQTVPESSPKMLAYGLHGNMNPGGIDSSTHPCTFEET